MAYFFVQSSEMYEIDGSYPVVEVKFKQSILFKMCFIFPEFSSLFHLDCQCSTVSKMCAFFFLEGGEVFFCTLCLNDCVHN